MADETTQTTQTAPVAGAENATQTDEKKLYVYYFSDPDATDQLLRFHPIYTEVPFGELPWHVHTEKPDETLKDPVWDINTNSWVENSKTGQAQILAEAQAKIIELDKAKEQLEHINSANAQQTQMITKQLGNQAEQNKNIMTMMGQMQQTLAILAKNSQSTSQAGTQTTPVQPTTNPTVNTDTNGGNN